MQKHFWRAEGHCREANSIFILEATSPVGKARQFWETYFRDTDEEVGEVLSLKFAENALEKAKEDCEEARQLLKDAKAERSELRERALLLLETNDYSDDPRFKSVLKPLERMLSLP